MHIIGITGGIGSGKSTLGRMLEKKGYFVIDLDAVAHELTAPGSPVVHEIGRVLGAEVITESGALDRRKAASVAFSSPEKLKALESILHPLILSEARRRADESGRSLVFLIAPLLFETGNERLVDEIWLCYAPQDARVRRAAGRNGSGEPEVLLRVRNQMPDELKIERSDVVIDTSGTLEDVERQLEEALKRLPAEA